MVTKFLYAVGVLFRNFLNFCLSMLILCMLLEFPPTVTGKEGRDIERGFHIEFSLFISLFFLSLHVIELFWYCASRFCILGLIEFITEVEFKALLVLTRFSVALATNLDSFWRKRTWHWSSEPLYNVIRWPTSCLVLSSLKQRSFILKVFFTGKQNYAVLLL